MAAVVRNRGLAGVRRCPSSAPLVVLGSGLWNGYAAHQIGLAAFTAWLAVPRERRSRPVVVLVFSLLTFFSHALVFFAFAVAVGCLAAGGPSRRPGRPGQRAVGRADALVRRQLAARGGRRRGLARPPPRTWVAYKGYTFAKSGGYQNLIVNGVGDDRTLMLVGAAVNAATVACVLLLALPLVVRACARRRGASTPISWPGSRCS